MIVVSDTSSISNLLQIGELDILRLTFSRIIIPGAVFDEICQVDVRRIAIAELDWVEKVHLTDKSLRDRLLNELDLGEAEAIALALELNADYLLIDEAHGRKIAENLGIRITGILGVLIKAKQDGHISAIRPSIDRLVGEAGFWLNPSLISDVLKLVGEK